PQGQPRAANDASPSWVKPVSALGRGGVDCLALHRWVAAAVHPPPKVGPDSFDRRMNPAGFRSDAVLNVGDVPCRRSVTRHQKTVGWSTGGHVDPRGRWPIGTVRPK